MIDRKIYLIHVFFKILSFKRTFSSRDRVDNSLCGKVFGQIMGSSIDLMSTFSSCVVCLEFDLPKIRVLRMQHQFQRKNAYEDMGTKSGNAFCKNRIRKRKGYPSGGALVAKQLLRSVSS